MEKYKNYDVQYKVLLIGESGVGKTCLLKALAGEKFSTTMTTIGIDFKKEIFEIDGARVMLEIWDTAGQERFRTFTGSHLRGTQGLLLVFDLTRIDTLHQLNYWMEAIDKGINCKEPPPKLIIGNKSDLVDLRQVTRAMGQKLADENYERGYEETSCKTNTNVRETFHKLASILVETYHPLLTDAFKGKVTDYNRPKVKQAKKDSIVLTKADLELNRKSLETIDENAASSKCCAT